MQNQLSMKPEKQQLNATEASLRGFDFLCWGWFGHFLELTD